METVNNGGNMKPSHGFVKGKVLIKRGRQVVKFWKYNGYAVPEKDLDTARGVQLHTRYDGILYADRNIFFSKGIPNDYNGEKQWILKIEDWEPVEPR